MKSKLFYSVARYALAALFVFSGLTKAINPFGLSIQFNEYFGALSMPWLSFLSPVAAIVLPAFELLVGLFLLFGFWPRVTRWAVAVMMGFFTILTLWIALTNPVSDCGCFGDVLKISNWATFYKNLVFSALTVFLFVCKPLAKINLIPMVFLALVCLALPVYCYFTLPLIDATPYSVGANIYEKTQGTLREENHSQLIYRDIKSGEQRTFELSDTTWQDTARWEYVDTKTTTISSGKAPEISTLAFLSPERGDLTRNILTQPGYLYLLVVADPSALSDRQVARVDKLIADMRIRLVPVVLLSALPAQEGGELSTILQLMVDRSTLHTMVQNKWGGAILLCDGVIEKKWAL